MESTRENDSPFRMTRHDLRGQCGGDQPGVDGGGARGDDQRLGLVDNWLRHVGDVMLKRAEALQRIADPAARHARLCELNVIEQAVNVCQTTVVQDAWERGQPLSVHGWIYGLNDGLVRDLGLGITERAATTSSAAAAIAALDEESP